MSFLSPVGGLIGRTDANRSRSQGGRERMPAGKDIHPTGEREAANRLHRLFQGNQDGIEAPALRAYTYPSNELAKNSPELLLWDAGTRELEGAVPSGLDFLESLIGAVEAPADWAAEHDHYLYGSPRRHEQ